MKEGNKGVHDGELWLTERGTLNLIINKKSLSKWMCKISYYNRGKKENRNGCGVGVGFSKNVDVSVEGRNLRTISTRRHRLILLTTDSRIPSFLTRSCIMNLSKTV